MQGTSWSDENMTVISFFPSFHAKKHICCINSSYTPWIFNDPKNINMESVPLRVGLHVLFQIWYRMYLLNVMLWLGEKNSLFIPFMSIVQEGRSLNKSRVESDEFIVKTTRNNAE